MNKHLEKLSKVPLPVKLGVAFGIAVLLTVGNAFALIKPVEDAITAAQNEERTLNAKLLEKKSIAQNINDRRREMEELENQLKEALTELPEQKEIEELLAQLNDVGRKSGLEIARIEPGTEVNADFYAKIPIKVMVKGNYHEVAMFMQEISNLRRIVNVNEIQLDAPSMKNDKMMLDSKFTATTFRFVDKAEQGKGANNAAAPGGKKG